MRLRRFLPQIVLASLMILAPIFITARETGRIEGRIIDKHSGKPLVGAAVQIVGTMTGAISDRDGHFVIYAVTPGTCTLRVSMIGYADLLVEGVVVEAGRRQELVVELIPMSSDIDEAHVMSEEGKKMETVGKAMHDKVTASVCVPVLNCQRVRINPGEYGGQPYPPAHGGTAIVNGQAFDAMFFKNYGVNPFVDTEDDHLSTFAIDVDDASYIMTRSYLERGSIPPDEAVRVEEFVNHFDYGYEAPHDRPFEIYFEGAPSEFGQNCSLLRIGIKGMEILAEQRKPANLVFVIDVSGSMGRENRLGLVKRALRLLVDELREDDRVGIVVYGSQGREILAPTSIRERQRILDAIEWLQTGGSTYAEEGIRLGYSMADRVFEPGKINRIILCSDGVANVGQTASKDVLRQIKQYADRGITLSAVGFGMGNYNDILMEQLGNKGNGHYAYVDDIAEARRIFVDNLTGNLQVIARDVKIQVDFDSSVIRSYRLLGYENRDVDDDKFRDDKEDGGEIGGGHEATALYEIKFRGNSRPRRIGTVYVRYKDPDSFEVSEISREITGDVFGRNFAGASPQFKVAAVAAEFAEILRKSYWAKGSKLSDLLETARTVFTEHASDDMLELLHLITKANHLQTDLADK